MSALWKLSGPLSPTKDSSQPLELVRCIGTAIHKTDSGITRVNMENSEFAKLTKKQTKSSIRSKPGNLRPKWSYESMSQLAIYPRLGTMNAEKWWSTEMSGWDLSERTKSCHRFKSPSRRPSPAFWASHASRVTTARTHHSQDSKASRLQSSMKHENYQSSRGSTEPLNRPMQSRKIPLKRRTLCLKASMTAGLHGPCVLQCVGFAPGQGNAGLEKSCNSNMNSQHFSIFTRGSCRNRYGGLCGSFRSKVALTSMGAPRQSTISTIANKRACCISDMQGFQWMREIHPYSKGPSSLAQHQLEATQKSSCCQGNMGKNGEKIFRFKVHI